MDQQMLDATMRLVHATWGVVIATFLLVLATAGMLWDSWRKGDEEREHRKREEKIRAEENRPKAAFGLNRRSDSHIELWCTNLGTVSFLVPEMLIDPVNPWNDSKQLKIALGEHDQPVVPAGEMRSTSIDVSRFERYMIRNAGVTLSLQGPSGAIIVTDEKPYFLHLIYGQIADVADGEYNAKRPLFGLQSNEYIFCPKCQTHVADFHVEALRLRRIAEKRLQR